MANRQSTFMEMQNSLFLHHGLVSMLVTEKLHGAINYRSWKRALEINISTKRKLGFLTGTIVRSDDDPVKVEQWDACNNLVISWIMNFVVDSMAKSILHIETASEIWKHLENRFNLSNELRKYKLNRDLYNLKQLNLNVNEICTKFESIREELDSIWRH